MIHLPVLLIGILLLVEISIIFISNHSRFQKYFSIVPSLFWIYFIPMVLSSVGILDPKSPVFQLIITWALPPSLFLLLVTVDIRAILRLGRMSLLMFFVGSFGVMLGTVVVFSVMKNIVGTQFWSGFAALSGSWTGGSANMIAVKEALSTPDDVFSLMVIVDTIVPYAWMGILIASLGWQGAFDRWNHASANVFNQLGAQSQLSKVAGKIKISSMVVVLCIAVIASCFSQFLSRSLPVIPNMISAFTWNIIIISILGLTLSLTRLKRVEEYGSTKIGYFILYFVLTAIGAKSSLVHIDKTLILILSGVFIVAIHFCVLMVAARFLKAPMFLVAVSSQANIGGVASAPIIAEIYQPGLSSVGLLLAILGNIVGTYIGILTGQICRFFI